MELRDRINNLKEYFKAFNIFEDTAYVLVNLPNKWEIFESDVQEEYGVTVKKTNDGVFFLCDSNDDVNMLFDSVEYVVNNNIALEEKRHLLEDKIKELGRLFSNESLEKLKTLQFVFINGDTSVEDSVGNSEIKQSETVDSTEPLTVKKNNRKKNKNKQSSQITEDSDMMDFAKTLINEE